jgi:hypothetical protein
MPTLPPHQLCFFSNSQLTLSSSFSAAAAAAAAAAQLRHPTPHPTPSPAGCAAGFGSYVQPPTTGYPYYPPISCPIWANAKSGSLKTATVRTTLPNGRAGPAVSLKTWYATKPDFCSRTYYPTKACQGSIPVKTVGFCQCFACPAGECNVLHRVMSCSCVCGVCE